MGIHKEPKRSYGGSEWLWFRRGAKELTSDPSVLEPEEFDGLRMDTGRFPNLCRSYETREYALIDLAFSRHGVERDPFGGPGFVWKDFRLDLDGGSVIIYRGGDFVGCTDDIEKWFEEQEGLCDA